jgi:hypothetical protein
LYDEILALIKICCDRICSFMNHVCSRQVFVDDHFLLRNFGPYRIIFATMCVIFGFAVSNVLLFEITTFDFPVILDG